MKNTQWILLDTETTGISAPIYVVEIGAQKMRGWTPEGPAFRRLINQNLDIPPEASRIHGYTREILERDGDPAAVVYRDFASYVSDLPLVAYNLEYDLDEVLLPEWKRLNIGPIGVSGFCALRLAQRLLDPVPSGNCKLQTLRQYYRLPDRGAHTALGDVETVADLMATVLRPIAEHRNLFSWKDVQDYTNAEWFPSRIAFGKFKGRHFQDAKNDDALLGWLNWLAGATNARTAQMGRWYLARLDGDEDATESGSELNDEANSDFAENSAQERILQTTSVVIFHDREVEHLRRLIASARSRLAELDTTYTAERHAVDVTQSILFKLTRVHYEKRDKWRLIIDYRSKYLKILLRAGEEEAAQVAEEYINAKTQAESDYEQAGATAAERKDLSSEEEQELKSLWKKLVRLYHPDRFAHQPDKLETYHHLTSAINQAREIGDISKLRDIANDPHEFILRAGWGSLNFDDAVEQKNLRRLLDSLRLEIVQAIELLSNLHESAEYELFTLSKQRPGLLEEIAAEREKVLQAEVEQLQAEADKLKVEISNLTDEEVMID